MIPVDCRSRSGYNIFEEGFSMTKSEFVTYCIQHHEDFPDVSDISLETARSVVANLDPEAGLPDISPEEFAEIWNDLVHDPKVMEE